MKQGISKATPQVPAPAGSTPLGIKPAAVLRVGDAVMWRGAWGLQPAQRAIVTDMQRTKYEREKYGKDVQSAPWSEKNYLVVSLDNGHWAYGEQLSPILPDSSSAAIFEQFQREAETQGYITGESAKAFAERHPESGKVLADFIRDHKAELVAATAKALAEPLVQP